MIFRHEFTGVQRYGTMVEAWPHKLLVWISCSIAQHPGIPTALLDTAAERCVLPAAVAGSPGYELSGGSAESTRLGLITGWVERITVIFTANDGQPFEIEASWFISQEWLGPVVIGWRGCLERMRFTFNPREDRFYFGAL